MKTISKQLFAFFILVLSGSYLMAGNYDLDVDKSSLKWRGKKVTGEHFGSISFEKGTINVTNGEITGANVVTDMTSIVVEDLENETWNQKLKDHLKSDDFFSVENHPSSKLVVENVEKVTGNTYAFSGNLTIKGITKPVDFEADVDVNGSVLKAEGNVKVDRTLYDIKFRSGKFFSDLGDNLIDDHFNLTFSLVAKSVSDEL